MVRKNILRRGLAVLMTCGVLAGVVNPVVSKASEDYSGYMTWEEALDEMYVSLRNREEYIEVKYVAEYLSEDSFQVVTPTYISRIHDDEPDMGDYLMSNIDYVMPVIYDEVHVGNKYYIHQKYRYVYHSTLGQEKEVDAEVKRVLDELDVYDADNYSKVEAVYRYVTDNVAYDGRQKNFSTYSALIGKKTVCQGYASLVYRLLKELGVDVRMVNGDPQNNNGDAGHVWNIVRLGDSNYYHLDTCYDAGKYTEYYNYFLIGSVANAESSHSKYIRQRTYIKYLTEYSIPEDDYDINHTCSSSSSTVVKDEAVEPSCTESGLTSGSHCSYCGRVYVKQKVIPALGHIKEKDNAVKPNCTESGLTEGYHCSRCREVLIKQEVIPALGHKMLVDEAVEASCSRTGLTEGSHCTREGCTHRIRQEVVSKDSNNHVNTIVVEGTPATANSVGYTDGVYCKDCGKWVSGHKEIAYTPDNIGNVEEEENPKDPSDKTEGTEDADKDDDTPNTEKEEGTVNTDKTEETGSTDVVKKEDVVTVIGSGSVVSPSKTSTTVVKKVSVGKVKYVKVSKSGKKVKIRWSKVKNARGYVVSVSSSKKKVKAVAKVRGTSKKVSLKKGKKVYVRVKAYRVVGGKTIYGSWSSAKAYKVK